MKARSLMLYNVLININNFITIDSISKGKSIREGVYIDFWIDKHQFVAMYVFSYNIADFIIRKTNDNKIHCDTKETARFFIDFVNNSFIPIKDLMMFTYDKKHIIDKQYFQFNNDVKNILRFLIKRNYAL